MSGRREASLITHYSSLSTEIAIPPASVSTPLVPRARLPGRNCLSLLFGRFDVHAVVAAVDLRRRQAKRTRARGRFLRHVPAAAQVLPIVVRAPRRVGAARWIHSHRIG